MSIFKYEVLNPVINNKKPFYDFKRKLLFFPVKGVSYRYYVEVARNNNKNGNREYFILLNHNKFDENCRICHIDIYGRCQIRIQGELKEYIIRESSYRGNINIEYVESTEDYDVFIVE